LYLRSYRRYFRRSRFDVSAFYLLLAMVMLLLLMTPQLIEANPDFPGGSGSVDYQPFPSFILPMKNLSDKSKTDFYAGKALAHQAWVKSPSSTTARDGLGPLYNARTCLACHINGGRGLLPVNGKTSVSQAIVRLSVDGHDAKNGVKPEPTYGEQLQTQSTALAHQLRLQNYLESEVRPEAYVYIDWQHKTFTYPDGSKVKLRKPNLRFKNLAYGEMDANVRTSFRNAPALIGTGLLEQVSEADIQQNVLDQQKLEHISGKVNRVWDPIREQFVVGRFGWKANKPGIKVQTAAAFQADVGIANPVFPQQPCEQNQINCLQQQHGEDALGHEINDELLSLVTHFIQHIGVPKSRDLETSKQQLGRKLFAETGCIDCHRPSYTTVENEKFPYLSKQTIWPFTDLLLHDMGEGLADNRTDFLANGREWRTPPLWGIGLSQQVNASLLLLHDGRARSVEEAILWHGGEAQTSRGRFVALDKEHREMLIEYIKTL